MNIQTLITHDGAFHADEVMSTVILKALYPQAEILRSREKADITPAAGRVIYDVGGSYDPDLLIFDHHQRGGPTRDSGALYSSFGLIWKHFGKDYLAGPCGFDTALVEALHQRLDSKFVAKIDLVDTGGLALSSAGELSSMIFPTLIENFVPSFDDDAPEAMTRAFHRAIDFAGIVFAEAIRKEASKLRANDLARKDIEASGDGPILVLSRGMPFKEALKASGKENFLFVVTPRPGGTWTLGTIRVSDDSFEDKVKLPEAWAGLKDAELAAVTGVADAVFCHMARFIAVARSREGIMELARQAVEAAQAELAA